MIAKSLLALSFALIANIASADELEVRVQTGFTFGTDFGTVYSPSEYDINGSGNPYQTDGYTTATLNSKPKTDITAGMDVNYFFNNYFGINFGAGYAQFGVENQNVYLSSSGGSWNHYFPDFAVKGATLSLGPVFRLKIEGHEIFDKFNPYLGVSFVTLLGNISNTNFNTQSIAAFSAANPGATQTEQIIGGGYGEGGSSSFSAFGVMPRIGFAYQLTNEISVGAEYRYIDFQKVDGGAMRSFMDGFTTSLQTHNIVFNIGYRII